MKRLVLVAALAASTPALAQDSPESACRLKIMNITNNLPSSPRSAAEAAHKLDIARPFRTAAQACVPKFPSLRAQFDYVEKQWAEAEATVKDLERIEALESRGDELYQKVQAAKTWDELKALADEAARWDADLQAYRKETGRDPGVRTDNLATAMKTRAENFKLAEIAADDQKIRDTAVALRLGLKAEDSYDQKKIQEAFVRSGAEHLVVALPDKGKTDVPMRYEPVDLGSYGGGNMLASDGKKLPHDADYFLGYDGLKMHFARVHDPRALAAGTPGLVWEARGNEVVFVSMDGGRYVANVRQLMLGLTKPEAWPAEPLNDALDPREIEKLAAAGTLPAAIAKTMTDEAEATSKCANRIRDAAKPQFDAIAAADILPDTRRARYDQLNERLWKKARESCSAKEKAAHKAWEQAIVQHDKDRRETLAKTRARLLELANLKGS